MERATVIVAIPSLRCDEIYKVSSEEVPHLTLLYLGNVELSAEAMLYVQHAVKELSPFGMSVDYRGTLGEDEADVLFFEKNAWDMKRINEFRHYLMLNDEIKKAWNAAPQHNEWPEWTPHLTLGYPEAPAKEIEDERFHYVDFDRIAVWTGDFEGPEFRLRYADYDMEVAMSDISTETEKLGANAVAELFHYGKKGMKWGVRNDKGHEGEAVKTKKLDKLDKKWEKENAGQKGWIKAHNAMADRMNNGEIDKFNNDPRWKDVDLNKDGDLEKTYMDEYFKLSDKVYAEELVKLGTNPSGTKHYTMREDEDGNVYAELTSTGKVKHAEGDTKAVLKLNRDEKGHISSVTPTEVELKHYGVKGMRWGVTTKDRATQRTPSGTASKSKDKSPTEVTVTQKKPGAYAKSEGGANHPLHEDAVRTLATRQKARASKTDALSNAELKTAIERMRLEQQFKQLEFSDDRRSRGQKFIAGLFGQRKPHKFKDMDEEYGEQVKKALAESFAQKKKEDAA